MGKDQYVEKLKLSSALGDWIDLTSSLFRKVPDLAAVTFSGLHNDNEVVRISMSRKQFDEDFSGLQESIAAHAAVTFQSLGTGRSSDKAAEKEPAVCPWRSPPRRLRVHTRPLRGCLLFRARR
jgi:hypothetical protein